MARDWNAHWAAEAPAAQSVWAPQPNRQKAGLAAIVAWPLLLLLLQATLLNPDVIANFLRSLGLGPDPITGPEVVLGEQPRPVAPTPVTPTDLPTPVRPAILPTPDQIAKIDLKEPGVPSKPIVASGFRLLPSGWRFLVADASNVGQVNLGPLSMVARSSNPKFVDAKDGLRVHITSCTTPWVERNRIPVCQGRINGETSTTLRAMGSTAGARLGIEGGTPGTRNHLLMNYELPSTADNRYAQQVTDITYYINAEQKG